MTKYLEAGGFNSPANNSNYEANYDKVFGAVEADGVKVACVFYQELGEQAIGLESSITEVEVELAALIHKAAIRAKQLAEYREALGAIRKMGSCPCCTP